MKNEPSAYLVRMRRAYSVARMLAGRELLSEYRQSRMSVAWPVLYPLLYTLLFVLLRPVLGGGMPGHSPWAFATFVFIGFTMWQTWFEVLRAQMDSIRRNRALMNRGELSSGTLFGATTLVAIVHFAPRLLISLIAAIFFLDANGMSICMLVGFGLAVLLNGAVVGAILQPFATLSADVGKSIQSISLGLLVTGAIFLPLPAAPSRLMSLVISLNPMGSLLNAARAPALGQQMVNPFASILWLLITLAVAAIIPFLGRKILPILVERMGN